MNLFFPSLLAVLDSDTRSIQVPKVRSRCDWMTGLCVYTGSMSSFVLVV